MSKDIGIIIVGLILFGILWLGWGLFEQTRTQPQNDSDVLCTADAKMCPDGSYVGRIPPHCEFAPCPHTNFDTAPAQRGVR